MHDAPLMQRHLGLRAFNDVVLRHSAYGSDVNPDTYDYFEYFDKPKYNLIDRFVHLVTRPYYQSSMGAPQFLFNITGITLMDLMNMDLKTIDRIERSLNEMAEILNQEPPPPPKDPT